jgi:hypothetical protein
LQIPAFVLTVFIFAFFITHRASLKILQNQALLVLLILTFVQLVADLPMPISFYYRGYVTPATAAYCTWWSFFEFTLDVANEHLMAIISVQRHILIFQPHILQVLYKRCLLYYLPLAIGILFPTIFYIIIIVFYPCDGTQWDFTSNGCGYAECYFLYNKVLSTVDWLINNGLPLVIIILANVTLVIRVINQKRRRQQTIPWRKQRRLTLQLLLISCLYVFAWLPGFIIGICQELISSSFFAQIQTDYTTDMFYLVCLLLPWVCLGLLYLCYLCISFIDKNIINQLEQN